MAIGRPVVASKVGGIPEVIKDSKTGLLVNPGDPEDLAEKILSLLKNPFLALQLGEAGRKRVKHAFSLVQMVNNYESIYRSIC